MKRTGTECQAGVTLSMGKCLEEIQVWGVFPPWNKSWGDAVDGISWQQHGHHGATSSA